MKEIINNYGRRIKRTLHRIVIAQLRQLLTFAEGTQLLIKLIPTLTVALVVNLGMMKLNEISTVVCQQFLIELLNNGRIRDRETRGPSLSPYTVKGVQRSLSVCLEKAVDEGLIVKNPCSKVKMPITEKPEM